MRLLLLGLLITLSSFSVNECESGCLKMDIVILIDTSASVNGYQNFIADAYEVFYNRFDLSEHGIKISAYEFNTIAYQISSLTTNKNRLQKGAENIRYSILDGSTNLLSALYAASSEFMTNSRGGDVPKSLIIITDGLPDGYSEPICKNVVYSMKRMHPDLNVYGILIDNNSSGDNFLMSISDFYVSTSFEILANELEKLDMCF